MDLAKNKDFKASFIEGLQKLGFPLEFRIRKKLIDLGFDNVQEGYFTVITYGNEIVKTYDVSAYKTFSKKIHNDITLRMDLQLIGECKSSIDPKKFLFAIS